ncbi:class I SAM-dependent methyltransferase, partial [Candidatus Woesearchaeota archaeon]|nr:class I SAM-dependent methyltransferase [Candidatus Woesearchaeota archaeon]
LKAELIFEGYSKGEDPNFVSQARGRELTFEKSLKLIEKYAQKGRIYDVGTAGGSFLHVARKNKWEVYGCEPNKWMCRWSKKHYGLDITPGDIFTKKYPDNYFDVVTLWDVLEHVPSPSKVLFECNRILKKKGLLVVNYPDIGSGISKLMGRKWVFLLSVHLFYFTPKTIRRILDKTGFETIVLKKHFQRLALGYLVFRMRQYSNILHNIGKKIIGIFKINKMQIPYWLGQTLVLARKK